MNEEIAQDALTYYDLPSAHLTFLGQSQNTTFRVETEIPSGDKFLLRLHTSIESPGDDSQDIWREPSVIQSELLWLNAISLDTELTVPQPVQNRLDEWVTSLVRTELESPISCSLLRWVEGEHLEGEPTAQQIRHLGVLMAQLHQHSNGWEVPSSFFRPNHDVEQLKSATSQLATLLQEGVMSVDDYQVFREAAEQIEEGIADLPKTRDSWDLIHADLHQGNYVLSGNKVCPIDFSRCGFGFYLYDIAMSLGNVEVPLRLHFLEGYTSIRELSVGYQHIVESFFNGATIENFAFHSTNPREYEWLSSAVPYVVKNHLCPYLRGTEFLFLK